MKNFADFLKISGQNPPSSFGPGPGNKKNGRTIPYLKPNFYPYKRLAHTVRYIFKDYFFIYA